MAVRLLGDSFRPLWNTRSQAGVGPPTIIMRDPVVKQPAMMLFTTRNHPIETLSPYRADQPFANAFA